jgi:hypothetical protein
MLNTITIKAKNIKAKKCKNQFILLWQNDDLSETVFICTVHGFENAIRVARGIAHEQAEYVKYPAFNPFEEATA